MQDVRISHHTGLPTTHQELKRCIPGWVHGDAVQYHERDSLMTWSWGSMLSLDLSSLMSSFLFAAWPKLATTIGTWDSLMKVFAWSLQALAKGIWPAQQWNGTPWPADSEDARRAGSQLADGWKLVVLGLLGDHEHFGNNLGMPH